MMNKNANNLNQNQDQLTEQQLIELENDPLWSLLSEAENSSSADVTPMFARNVMREIRLNHSQKASSSLWNRLFTSRFNKISLGLGLAAACAVIVITQIADQNPTQAPITTNNPATDELSETIKLDELDEFTDEMLEITNQDPFFISEDEIEIAMQM